MCGQCGEASEDVHKLVWGGGLGGLAYGRFNIGVVHICQQLKERLNSGHSTVEIKLIS